MARYFLSTRSPSSVKKGESRATKFSAAISTVPPHLRWPRQLQRLGGPRFCHAVYIPIPTRCVFGRVGLVLSTLELRSGSVYWCCCDFGGRRRGGEGVSHSSFDGSFFVDFGFPVSAIDNSSRLGLGFESFPSFSGMGSVVGGWVSVLLHGRELHSNVFICRGFDIDELCLVSFFYVDVQILWVFPCVVCASRVIGAAKSITYNMPAARWSFGTFAGEVFIGRL